MTINRTINHFLARSAAQTGGKYSRLCSAGSPCGRRTNPSRRLLGRDGPQREGPLPVSWSPINANWMAAAPGSRGSGLIPLLMHLLPLGSSHRRPPRATDYSLSFVAIGRLSASIYLCPARPRCQAQMINQRQVSGKKAPKATPGGGLFAYVTHNPSPHVDLNIGRVVPSEGGSGFFSRVSG